MLFLEVFIRETLITQEKTERKPNEKYEGEYFVLHNTTTEFLSDGTEKSYYRCVISPMSLGKRGNTMMEQLLEVKVP